jgi:hypothetical protein
MPWGKVNILRGHSIGHSKQKKKKDMYSCPIPNCLRDRAITLYSLKIFDQKDYISY